MWVLSGARVRFSGRRSHKKKFFTGRGIQTARQRVSFPCPSHPAGRFRSHTNCRRCRRNKEPRRGFHSEMHDDRQAIAFRATGSGFGPVFHRYGELGFSLPGNFQGRPLVCRNTPFIADIGYPESGGDGGRQFEGVIGGRTKTSIRYIGIKILFCPLFWP